LAGEPLPANLVSGPDTSRHIAFLLSQHSPGNFRQRSFYFLIGVGRK
jgi:hypothetical protein